MRRLLFAILLCVIAAGRAHAACTSLPYVFQNGVVADATQVNADLQTLLSCAKGIQNPNILLNPAFLLDYQNAGTSQSCTGCSVYSADQWVLSSDGGAGTPTLAIQVVNDAPAGFTNSLKITDSAGGTLGAGSFVTISQPLEGYQLSDLSFGSATASSVCVAFWAKSSIAPYTASNSLRNQTGGIGGPVTRANFWNFTITQANAWQNFTNCVSGDVAGSWVVNTTAEAMIFDVVPVAGTTFQGSPNVWSASNVFGSSSNTNSFYTTTGATFQLAGVKLETGVTNTPFTLQDLATEANAAQRYWETSHDPTSPVTTISINGSSRIIGTAGAAAPAGRSVDFKSTKRCIPTITMYSTATGASGKVRDNINGVDVTPTISDIGFNGFLWEATPSVGAVVDLSGQWVANCRL